METAMKINEETRKHLTAEEYQWTQDNVENYKHLTLAGVDYVILLLKSGNVAMSTSIEDAIRMEMNQTGEIIEMDGFETDELNSLLWDE
jgi:hypothetical protein